MSNIVCYDSDGNVLRTLYQWDTNQTMKVVGLGNEAPAFHFCNKYSEEALVVSPTLSEDELVVSIPNILLQQAETIIVYLYVDTTGNGYRTIHTIRIPVIPRPIPDDYEYVENIDYISVGMLSARLSAILKALTEQETSDVSLEVIDIRTGYDGTEYDAAGDAVRAVGTLAGKTADVVFDPIDSDVETTIRTGHYVSKSGVDTQSLIYNCTGRIAVSTGDVLSMTGTSLGAVGTVGINYVCAYRADGVVNEGAGYGTTAAPLSIYTVPSDVAEVVLSCKATFSNVSVIRTRKELALARRDEVDAVADLTSAWEESGVSPTVFLLSHAVTNRDGSAMILDDDNAKYVAKFNSAGDEGGYVHTSIYKYDNDRVDIEFYRDDDEKIGSISYTVGEEPWSIELEDVANVAANGMIEKNVTSGYIAYASDPSSDYPAYISTLDDGRYRIKTNLMTITAEKTTVAGYKKYLFVRKSYDDGFTYEEAYIDGELYQTVETGIEGNDTIIKPWKVVEDIEELENKSTVLENKIKEQERRIKDLEAAAEGVLYRVELETDVAYSKTVPAKAIDGKVNSIYGKSVVLNQIIADVPSGGTSYGITMQRTATGTIHVYGTSESSTNFVVADNSGVYASGRVYLASLGVSQLPDGARINTSQSNGATASIVNGDGSDVRYGVFIDEGTIIDVELKPYCIDLTKMFGAGNEPTTVEQAYGMGVPRTYIPYNAGEVVGTDVTDVVVSGAGIEPVSHPVPQAIRNLPSYAHGVRTSAYSGNIVSFATKTYTQNVAICTLNGSNVVSVGSSSGVRYADIKMPYAAPAGTARAVDNYGDRMAGQSAGTDGSVRFVLDGSTLRRFDNLYTSKAAAISQLNDRPLTVVFWLATPIITDISDILLHDEFWLDGATEGRTVTFEQSGGMTLPVPNELSYLIKLGGEST